MSTAFRYSLSYTVTAATRLEAIEKAVAMLRRGVYVRTVGEVTQVGSGDGAADRWTVCLSVEEDV